MRGRGIHPHAAADLHPSGRGLDKPAITTKITTASADAAIDFGHAVVIGQIGYQQCRPASADFSGRCIHIDVAGMRDAVAGHQANRPAVIHQSRGFEAARVIDHTTLQPIRRLRRQNDQSARSLHRIAVFNQRSNRRRFDTDVGQTCAVKLQLKRFAGGQCHGAALRNDHAVVAYFGGQQGDVAIQFSREVAVVFNFTGGAVAGEVEIAGHEVGIADAVRSGGECADVDAGAAAEIDAAAVGEENLAVAGEPAEDLARVGIEHAVQYRRAT